jgi:hypothetical protein
MEDGGVEISGVGGMMMRSFLGNKLKISRAGDRVGGTKVGVSEGKRDLNEDEASSEISLILSTEL